MSACGHLGVLRVQEAQAQETGNEQTQAELAAGMSKARVKRPEL